MTWLLPFITIATLLVAALRSLVDWLNWKRSETSKLPAEFEGIFTPARFEESKAYLAAQTKTRLLERAVWTFASLAFLWAGGFGAVDTYARSFGYGPIVTSLLFFLGLGLLSEIISLPFGYYSTFVTEEKFGFNRSSLKTFVADHLKGWALGIVIGGPILAGLLWFFQVAGGSAWAYAWGFLAVMQLVIGFFAPVVLMPLFNKFTPLPAGELKEAIETYAKGVSFKLQGIFTMDGSKRSAKANAFFTGLGRFRRIVLFDTLVKQHPTDELVAVLAHEVGHFKRGHIPRMIGASLFTLLALFFLLSLVLSSP
ncbi:MAG: M48 family peptidase, partial [Proteobacteria bacterium]